MIWRAALALAQGADNQAIRREAWHHWLLWEGSGVYDWSMYWPELIGTEGVTDLAIYHVVRPDEFGPAEFDANDWTNLPWDPDIVPIGGPIGGPIDVPIFPRPPIRVTRGRYVAPDASPVIPTGTPATLDLVFSTDPLPTDEPVFYSVGPDGLIGTEDDYSLGTSYTTGDPYSTYVGGHYFCWAPGYPATVHVTMTVTSGGGLSGIMGTLTATLGTGGDLVTVTLDGTPGVSVTLDTDIVLVPGGIIPYSAHYRQEVPVPPYAAVPDCVRSSADLSPATFAPVC